MLEKFRSQVTDFMYGRAGLDNLTRCLIYLAVIINILTIFFNTTFLIVLNTIVIMVAGFRFFSRDLEKRQEENIYFQNLIEKCKKKIKGDERVKQLKKTHCLFKCPRCGLKMKVPKGRGKIEITCCKCSCVFEIKS